MSKSNRPRCAHCLKRYGRRDTKEVTVKYPPCEVMPPYTGNGIVLKTSKPYKTADRATMRGVTMISANPEIRARQEEEIARAPEQSMLVATRTIWDGVSWTGGYPPFCTLRCALAYAREAHQNTPNADEDNSDERYRHRHG